MSIPQNHSTFSANSKSLAHAQHLNKPIFEKIASTLRSTIGIWRRTYEVVMIR